MPERFLYFIKSRYFQSWPCWDRFIQAVLDSFLFESYTYAKSSVLFLQYRNSVYGKIHCLNQCDLLLSYILATDKSNQKHMQYNFGYTLTISLRMLICPLTQLIVVLFYLQC